MQKISLKQAGYNIARDEKRHQDILVDIRHICCCFGKRQTKQRESSTHILGKPCLLQVRESVEWILTWLNCILSELFVADCQTSLSFFMNSYCATWICPWSSAQVTQLLCLLFSQTFDAFEIFFVNQKFGTVSINNLLVFNAALILYSQNLTLTLLRQLLVILLTQIF